MQIKCEFSSINIPNESRYALVAARYVVEIAMMMGFMESELQSIERAITQTVEALITYSFEPREKATLQITCERIPEGLKVVVKDKGLPFDSSVVIPAGIGSDSEFEKRITAITDLMDEVRPENLGKNGKQIVLLKHLPAPSLADYFAACEFDPQTERVEENLSTADRQACTVRQMQEAEAGEVSKTVYRAYGYSYPLEYIYYPEKIIALNKSGRIHSAVAVAGNKEIAGHCALQTWNANPAVAEMGQGAVKPEFRSLGCFAKLTEYLLAAAKTKGLVGVFDRAVTNHTHSQQTGHQTGARDCAILIGHIPQEATFKALTGKLSQRGSMVMQFNYLKKSRRRKIYPPARHQNMIRKLCEHLNIEFSEIVSGSETHAPVDHLSVFKTEQIIPTKFARISIERYGKDILQEIGLKLKELALHKNEVVNLYLNLSNPLTAGLTPQFEALGFFFAGIMPECYPDSDALILQYLNQVPIDYNEIQVVSDTAKQLLDYIKNHDPNRIRAKSPS